MNKGIDRVELETLRKEHQKRVACTNTGYVFRGYGEVRTINVFDHPIFHLGLDAREHFCGFYSRSGSYISPVRDGGMMHACTLIEDAFATSIVFAFLTAMNSSSNRVFDHRLGEYLIGNGYVWSPSAIRDLFILDGCGEVAVLELNRYGGSNLFPVSVINPETKQESVIFLDILWNAMDNGSGWIVETLLLPECDDHNGLLGDVLFLPRRFEPEF